MAGSCEETQGDAVAVFLAETEGGTGLEFCPDVLGVGGVPDGVLAEFVDRHPAVEQAEQVADNVEIEPEVVVSRSGNGG